jgi:hypothetical protein
MRENDGGVNLTKIHCKQICVSMKPPVQLIHALKKIQTNQEFWSSDLQPLPLSNPESLLIIPKPQFLCKDAVATV